MATKFKRFPIEPSKENLLKWMENKIVILNEYGKLEITNRSYINWQLGNKPTRLYIFDIIPNKIITTKLTKEEQDLK